MDRRASRARTQGTGGTDLHPKGTSDRTPHQDAIAAPEVGITRAQENVAAGRDGIAEPNTTVPASQKGGRKKGSRNSKKKHQDNPPSFTKFQRGRARGLFAALDNGDADLED